MAALVNTPAIWGLSRKVRVRWLGWPPVNAPFYFGIEGQQEQDPEVSSRSVERLLILSELQVHRNSSCHLPEELSIAPNFQLSSLEMYTGSTNSVLILSVSNHF